MATFHLSGTVSHPSWSDWSVRVECEETSQSIINNTTNVTLRLQVRPNYDNGYLPYSNLGITALNGETHTSVNYDFRGKKDTWVTLHSRSISNIAHNADGTCNYSISASFNPNDSEISSITYASVSGSIALTTIPRASEIVSIGTFNIEEPFALEIDKKAESFTDKLTIKLGDEVIKVINDYESEENIEFTDDEQLTLYNLIDDWSDTLTFLLQTYNGGTLIGSDTATETVTIKGDVTYHTGGADKGATFYVGTSDGIKRCITYDGTARTYR